MSLVARNQHRWRQLARAFALSLGVSLLAVVLLILVGAHQILSRTWAADFHDNVVLPLAVERVLTEPWWLVLCLTIVCVSVLLWPHVAFYQAVVWVLVAASVFWVGYYRMWYYRPVAAGIIITVLAYTLLRYFWDVVVRAVPIVGRRSFVSIERFVKETYRCARKKGRVREGRQGLWYDDDTGCPARHLAIDLYYDAIRALSFPRRSSGNSAPLAHLWDRSECDPSGISQGFWSGMFVGPAKWYRCFGRGPSSFSVLLGGIWWGILRICVGRRSPASLSVPWLASILAAEEKRRFAQIMEESSLSEHWFQLFYEWVQAVERQIEYWLFDPAQHSSTSPFLLWAAEKYDELSRVGMMAQLAAVNLSNAKELAGRWFEIGRARLRFIRKAMLLRAYALSWDTSWEKDFRDVVLQQSSWRNREVPLVYAICRFQVSWYEGSVLEPSQLVHAVVQLVSEADREGAPVSRMLLWKAVELACDIGDFQLALELLLRPEIRETPAVFPVGPEGHLPGRGVVGGEDVPRDAWLASRMEGHLAWWLARSTEELAVQMRAYRHAFGSFCEAGSAEVESLRSHLRQFTAGH
jgi:hypothetical protein